MADSEQNHGAYLRYFVSDLQYVTSFYDSLKGEQKCVN